MNKKTIKEVYKLFNNSEDSGICSYRVGDSFGTTTIKEAFKNGENALIKYYEIYNKDKLIAELHDFTGVIYE